MPNPVVHFEITGQDAEALQQYYRDLFGWSLPPMAPDVPYGLVRPEETGGGIGGGVGASMDGASLLTVYVQVDDIQGALDRAVQLGGEVVQPPPSSRGPSPTPSSGTSRATRGARRLGDAARRVRHGLG